MGGGIIGASIAWLLGREQIRVTVCEAATLGAEASWAGAGMLVPGSEFEQPGEWLDFALHSLSLYPEFVQRLREESDGEIDFSLCGSLELAANEEEFERLTARANRQAALGISSERVLAADLYSRVPGLTQTLGGAVFYPREGQVDPRTVCNALRKAFLKCGVELRERTPVVTLYPYADGVDAKLETGEVISATVAVVAAGAWSSHLRVYERLMPATFPVRGHLLGYRLAPASLPHILRFQHTYVVQRRSGFTIAGASEEDVGFNRTLDPLVVAGLADRAHQLVGGLLPLEPGEAWVGFRPATPTGVPVIAQLDDVPVWLAYGHYRNGILLAPATAERIAGVIRASLR